jgi:hypothetical protein
MPKRKQLLACVVAALAWGIGITAQAPVAPPQSAPLLTDEEQETFLLKARVIRTRAAGKGVTGSLRATLTDGTLTHDGQIQTVDEYKREFASSAGLELDFVDSWKFNVAAYRVDRMLGLGLVPVSVERDWHTARAAYTWWLDDVLMDEETRLKLKTPPPRALEWVEQMQLISLFDELIYNVDRNLGNLLITKDWRVWAIDHTRAFRMQARLRKPENVTRCDRQVFERLKQLDRAGLERELRGLVDSGRIRALLSRRDAIVKRIESLGPTALFDRQAHDPLRRELQLGLGVPGRLRLALEQRTLGHLQHGR